MNEHKSPATLVAFDSPAGAASCDLPWADRAWSSASPHLAADTPLSEGFVAHSFVFRSITFTNHTLFESCGRWKSTGTGGCPCLFCLSPYILSSGVR